MKPHALSAYRHPLAARHSLPGGYCAIRRLDLESPRTVLALGLLSVAMLAAGLVGFGLAAVALPGPGADPLASLNPLALSAAVIGMAALMLAAHEAFHGLAFRLFGARPRFGLHLSKGVAYAAAPGDYLPRDAYLAVALAPLVGVTAVCLACMALSGGATRTLIALVGAANVSGAAGDVWFFAECLGRGRELLVRDYGEGAELYLPQSAPGASSPAQIHENQRGDTAAGEDHDQGAAQPDHAARHSQ